MYCRSSTAPPGPPDPCSDRAGARCRRAPARPLDLALVPQITAPASSSAPGTAATSSRWRSHDLAGRLCRGCPTPPTNPYWLCIYCAGAGKNVAGNVSGGWSSPARKSPKYPRAGPLPGGLKSENNTQRFPRNLEIFLKGKKGEKKESCTALSGDVNLAGFQGKRVFFFFGEVIKMADDLTSTNKKHFE